MDRPADTGTTARTDTLAHSGAGHTAHPGTRSVGLVALVPAYGPDDRLPDLVTILRCTLRATVLVVDDGSGPAWDVTFQRAQASGAEDKPSLFGARLRRRGRGLHTRPRCGTLELDGKASRSRQSRPPGMRVAAWRRLAAPASYRHKPSGRHAPGWNNANFPAGTTPTSRLNGRQLPG